jgi:hypothetical protein
MRKVVARGKPDVSGKAVDQIFLSTTAFMFAFDADVYAPRDIELRAVDALRRLAQSLNPRDTRRDFVVLFGTARNSQGENLLCLCLPENISARVTKHFREALHPVRSIATGIYPLGDVELTPLARYTDGTIIVYTSASAAAGSLPPVFEPLSSWGVTYETRSALLHPAPTPPPQYGILPEHLAPAGVRGERHTIEDHQLISKSLDSIIRSSVNPTIGAPFGYEQLRSFCVRRLGIQIYEDSLPNNCSGLTGMGRVHIDDEGTGARVMIRVKKTLPPETKYVSLAHELAHYRLHFPWLLVSRLAFDLSLRLPEAAVILNNFLRSKGDMKDRLERQADIYSSFFVLPPYADNLATVAQNMFLSDRPPTPEELAWKFLTPFFPNENVGGPTWKEHHVRNRQAADALTSHEYGLTPGSLIERYFSAMVRRLRREYCSFGQNAAVDAAELMLLLSPPTDGTGITTKARAVIREHVERGEWRMPSSVKEFTEDFAELAGAYLGPGTLEVIPPPTPSNSDPICPVVVLVKARRSGRPNAGRGLIALPAMNKRAEANKETWIKRLPEHGVVVADVSPAVWDMLSKDASDERAGTGAPLGEGV